jgi:hypothetical protein
MQAKFEGTITKYEMYRRYARCLDRIVTFFRDRHPNDVFTVDVEAYRTWRLETRKPRTVDIECDAGRAFWSWMEAQDIVDHNPFRKGHTLN